MPPPALPTIRLVTKSSVNGNVPWREPLKYSDAVVDVKVADVRYHVLAGATADGDTELR